MVGTRHSLPSADDEADHPSSLTPSSTINKKAQAALKKLQIDGKGTLVGEKPQHEETETYHFRGAAYAVTKATRPEWIEGEPKRYRGRKEKRASVDRDGGHGRSSKDGVNRTTTPAGRGKADGSARKVRFGSAGGSATRKGEGGKKRKPSLSEGGSEENVEMDAQSRKRPYTIGARKTAYTAAPSSKPARRGSAFSPITAPSSRKRKAAAAIPPPHRLALPTPSSNDEEETYTTSAHAHTLPQQPVKVPKKNERLRRIQLDLVRIARTNTDIQSTRTKLKKIFLQQRLRELRYGGGNQLCCIPDPRTTYPRPEPVSPLRAAPSDDAKPPQDEDPPRTSPTSSTTPSPPRRSPTSPDSSDDEASSTSSPPSSTSPPTTSASFSLNNHLGNEDRAESQIFSVRKARQGKERRGMRKRRVAREMDVVRNLWDEGEGDEG